MISKRNDEREKFFFFYIMKDEFLNLKRSLVSKTISGFFYCCQVTSK